MNMRSCLSKIALISTIAFIASAHASEPVWMTWEKIELSSEGGFSISAERDHQSRFLNYFRIGTPDGNVSLSEEVLSKLEMPRLNYIEYISVPQTVSGPPFKYHVAIRYGRWDPDVEESCVLVENGEEYNFAPEKILAMIIFRGKIETLQWDHDCFAK